MNSEDFFKKYAVTKHLIAENEHWAWSLRPRQVTFASSLLSLKRPACDLSELSVAEFTSLQQIIYCLENTIRRVSAPKLFNYMSLMLVDRYVHFHVFPRFELESVGDSVECKDRFFPRPPDVTWACDFMSSQIFVEELKAKLLLQVR